jgi:hypothetical protein
VKVFEPSQPEVSLFIVLEGNVSISKMGEDDKLAAIVNLRLRDSLLSNHSSCVAAFSASSAR